MLAAILGVPVSGVAYGYLKLVALLQNWFFTQLPKQLGFGGTPAWWPLPLLALAGVLVAGHHHLSARHGRAQAGRGVQGRRGARRRWSSPGVFLASLATLSLGVVLGPEAPLIAIGGGLGALAIHLAKKDAPPTAAMVIASAGSFAAISALLGSPILGAFLLMEASGLGGPILGLMLVPGLLAAGIGTLIFIGLDSLTGFGSFSLSIPGPAPVQPPDRGHVPLGHRLRAGGGGAGDRDPLVGPGPPAGDRAADDGLDAAGRPGCGRAGHRFAEATGKGFTEVLFSGQSALPTLVLHAAAWTVGPLILLVACKSLAYGLSLSSFRGGPIFPAMFIGAGPGWPPPISRGCRSSRRWPWASGPWPRSCSNCPMTSTFWPRSCCPVTA